jgi:hypothetical protein
MLKNSRPSLRGCSVFGDRRIADVSALPSPILLVVIDTEEDFEWDAAPRRENVCVDSMAFMHRVQDIFDSYQIRPCYVVDYAVANQPASADVLTEIHSSGRCEIGAHLHPWVNPPFVEPLTRSNMFPGNLDPEVEAEKLRRLAGRIEEVFGCRPASYKAGRYGFGPSTRDTLQGLGFEVDLSICPAFDHGAEGGPDFTAEDVVPFWFGEDAALLAVPVTAGFVGWGGPAMRAAHRFATGLERFKLPGILSRIGVVDRLVLSPEGFSPAEHKKLTHALLARGVRTFTWSFHSSSVMPGAAPYVRTDADLRRFLDSFRSFFDFFFGELGGVTTTPRELRARLELTRC